MSIWCSWPSIGRDDFDGTDRGRVLTYPVGYSNRYPDGLDPLEIPTDLDVAHIPAWCVPGHREDDDSGAVGPWLRLWVAGPVVMDVEAVTALRDDLTRWLEREHVEPREAS